MTDVAFSERWFLVSTKDTVLPLQIAYAFSPTFKPPENTTSDT